MGHGRTWDVLRTHTECSPDATPRGRALEQRAWPRYAPGTALRLRAWPEHSEGGACAGQLCSVASIPLLEAAPQSAPCEPCP